MRYLNFTAKIASLLTSLLILMPATLAQPQSDSEIPKCPHSLGQVTVQPPEFIWWQKYPLPPPQELLSVLIRRSGCFTLAEEGQMAAFRLLPGVQERPQVYGSPAGQHFENIDSAFAEVFLRIGGSGLADVPQSFPGHADSGALSYGVGGGLDVFSGPLDPTLAVYARSDIGQLVTLAYIRAYRSLVQAMGKTTGQVK